MLPWPPVLESWPITLLPTPARAQLGWMSPRRWDPLLWCKDKGHTQINTHTLAPFVAYFTPHHLLLLLPNGKSRTGGGRWGRSRERPTEWTSWKIQWNVHSPCIFSRSHVSHVWPLIWPDKTRPDRTSRFTEPRRCGCAPFLTETLGWFILWRKHKQNQKDPNAMHTKKKSSSRVQRAGAFDPSLAPSRNARYAQLRRRYLHDVLSVSWACTGCSGTEEASSSSCKGQQHYHNAKANIAYY